MLLSSPSGFTHHFLHNNVKCDLHAIHCKSQFLCVRIIYKLQQTFWSIKKTLVCHRVCMCAFMCSVCNLLSTFLKLQFLTIVVLISYFVDKIKVINNDNNYCFQ